jgi:hypothetical protein
MVGNSIVGFRETGRKWLMDSGFLLGYKISEVNGGEHTEISLNCAP